MTRTDVMVRPRYAPDLHLKGVAATATTYSFVYPKGFGWALCTINDATGELHILSDWGNWSHGWSPNPKHLGQPTLTHFIGIRGDLFYLADKLTSREERQRFDAHETVRSLRKMLAERRLEEGRRYQAFGDGGRPCLLEDNARDIWNDLGELDDVNEPNLFIERYFDTDAKDWITSEPWEHLEHEPTTGYMVLVHSILPALQAACAERIRAQLPPSDWSFYP